MPTTESAFIIKKYEGFGGPFVDSQYLGAAYESAGPVTFYNTLMKIYSSRNRFFTGKPLLGMTGAKSYGMKEIDDEIYRWFLQGAEEKPARVLEVIEVGNTAPGLNNSTFRVKFEKAGGDYFMRPDVLMPEDADYPCEIVDGPIEDGIGVVYTLRLQGDDPTEFLPASLLEVGREWSKVWTSVASEGNQEFGTQQYPASFKLESQVGAFAQAFEVTDKAWRQQGRLGIDFLYTDPKTGKEKVVKSFLPMAEAKMNDELYMGMEAQMTYGKRQTKEAVYSKYWIKTGPGLRQQLRDGWIQYYNGPLTVDLLKEYLLDIFFSREDEENRKVVAMTGTLGSLMFHDMLASEASGFLTVDNHFVRTKDARMNHLSFGAQFTHYVGPEGIEVSLIKNPMYDSRKYNKRMHPEYTDKPIDSSRMTFLDFGSSGEDNNIMMLTVKDTYRWGYTVGTHGPTGPVKGGQAGVLKAGYEMFTEGTAGLWIKDVTRCGEIILDTE